METPYSILKVEPGCKKRQLKQAYRTALAGLEAGDLVGEDRLTQAYRQILADRKHQKPAHKQYGFWWVFYGCRVHFTGPLGSAAAKNMLHRFGLGSLFGGLLILAGCWAGNCGLEHITPNLFPASLYPRLARVFSAQLTASVFFCVLFAGCTIFYICRCLRRRENGFRQLQLGFIFGSFFLVVGLFLPQNQPARLAALLQDYSAVKQNAFSTTQNILLEDAFLQAQSPFGDTYTYKTKTENGEKTNTVYIPKELLQGENSTVHQGSVTYLPHTRAAATVQVRVAEIKPYGCIGDSFFITPPKNSGISSIYLRRSNATFYLEYRKSLLQPARVFSISLRSIPLQDVLLISTITTDKIFAVFPNPNICLLTFTAVSADGLHHSCILAKLDLQTGKVPYAKLLKEEFPYKLFTCAGRYFFFTQSPVTDSLLEQQYSMQIFDLQKQAMVYTAPQSFQLSSAPHVAFFEKDAVWLSKHSNGKDLVGAFSVPEIYLR